MSSPTILSIVEIFVDEFDLTTLWLCSRGAGGDRASSLSYGDNAPDLPVRLSQSHPVEPPLGARDLVQHGVDLVGRPVDVGLQDAGRLPQGQRPGDPGGLCAVRL